MNRTVQALSQEISKYFLEQSATVEPFIIEMVVKFVIASCYQDISRNIVISEKDRQQLKELVTSIITVEQPVTSITAYTLRLQGANVAEFVAYFDLREDLQKRPDTLAGQQFAQITPMNNPDAIYSSLEQLLMDVCRPFSLEQNNTSLAFSLKLSLNSILPRSDVVVFRDMLLKESQQDKPGQVPSGQRQLVELTEVTAGVSLTGDPPIAALQQLEQQLIILQKQIEIQLNQQLGVYISTLLPLQLYQFDANYLQNSKQLQIQKQLHLYLINRVAVIQAFMQLYKQIELTTQQFQSISEQFKNQITEVQELLKNQEAIPKSQIYPKFSQIARLYIKLQAISELLVQLKTWHSRIFAYLDDRTFTVLPDTNAKAPIYTSQDILTAREWFVKVFGPGNGDPGATAGSAGTKKSRFNRLALMVMSSERLQQPPAQFKDMNYFKAVDSEELADIDCLFNGLDVAMLFNPAFSLPVFAFGNFQGLCQDISSYSSKVSINNPKLDLPDNKVALNKATPSILLNNLLTIQVPQGYDYLSFVSSLSKSIFQQNPALFMAYSLAFTLQSPDYIPFIIMLEIPRVASLLNTVNSKQARQNLLNVYQTGYFDFNVLQRNQIATDEPPINMTDSLVYKNIGAKKFQISQFGYTTTPKYIELFEAFLLSRLSEQAGVKPVNSNIVSSPYNVEGLLQPEVLTYIADIFSGAVFQKYLTYKQGSYKLNVHSLVGQENVIYKNQRQAEERANTQVNQNTGMIDQEIQTPLHFYESHIVADYTSSEWELRARALRLYQIKQKQTKAVSTHIQANRVVEQTQTVEKKDADCQSKVDGTTNAVINYAYQRRIKYNSDLLYKNEADRVKKQCQIMMQLDLDQIKNDADRLKQSRKAVQPPQAAFDINKYYSTKQVGAIEEQPVPDEHHTPKEPEFIQDVDQLPASGLIVNEDHMMGNECSPPDANVQPSLREKMHEIRQEEKHRQRAEKNMHSHDRNEGENSPQQE